MKTVESVDSIVGIWPWSSAKVARAMVGKYGLPHEATEGSLVWHYNNPWKRTTLWRDGVHHNFPYSHLDILEQTLEYRVSLDKAPALLAFNGSLTVARTRGEMTVCCRDESMNFLIMNLAHEIMIGHLTAEQARVRQREVVSGLRFHWPEPDTQKLAFMTVRTGYGAGESDESISRANARLGPFRRR